MKNFNKVYFLVFAAFTCLSSCIEPYGANDAVVPVDATAVITDANGQALKNRIVSASGSGNVRQTGLTDENGRVHFSFLWNVYNESGPAIWAIQPVEDTTFKMVHFMVSPTSGGYSASKITITDSLKMDSLMSFKVRVKTSRTDVVSLILSVLHEGMKPLPNPIFGYEYLSGAEMTPFVKGQNSNNIIRQKRERVFLYHGKETNTPQLDTTFQMKALANTPFTVNCFMNYKGNTGMNQKKTVTAAAFRDSALLLQF